jgi:hypothetical protein
MDNLKGDVGVAWSVFLRNYAASTFLQTFTVTFIKESGIEAFDNIKHVDLTDRLSNPSKQLYAVSQQVMIQNPT